jgi:hypothetical protein
MGIGNWWGSVVKGATDAFGLTDTKAGERGLNTMQAGADTAQTSLKSNMQPVLDMYGGAMNGRNMDYLLGNYTTQMLGTENAAGPENVQNFVNPMYGNALAGAADQALAGAGSSLQSSAANNAVATSVGNQATSMCNQALQQALADAKNKQGIYGANLEANLMPFMQWGQLQADMAGTQYTKDMDLTQAAGQVSGQDQSWFGNLF